MLSGMGSAPGAGMAAPNTGRGMRMRRLLVSYHGLIALLLGVYLGVCWLLMAFLGRGSFTELDRYFVLGPLVMRFYLLAAITILFLPTVVFCGCRAIQCVSKNPDRFRGWVSLRALARLASIQAVFFLAILFGVLTPWGDIVHTNWIEVLSSVGQPPKPRELPTDADLEYPSLPLQETDPYAWSVKDLDGNEVPMAQFRGKPLFINFWATWCPPCRAELPNVQRLYDTMKDQGIGFLLISSETPEQVKTFLKGNSYTFPCYLVEEEPPMPFRVGSIPTTLLMTPDGKIAFTHSGAVAWDGQRTQEFLKQLAGTPVPAIIPAETPTDLPVPPANTAEIPANPTH